MPFKKNDPKTRRAATKGGYSGEKYLSTLSAKKLRELTVKAGKASGEKRRAIRDAKLSAKINRKADNSTERIMSTYIK